MVVSEIFDTNMNDFCQAQQAENTDPCTNYAVKYATARGYLIFYLQPGLERKFLLMRTWSGQKLCPLQYTGLPLP